MESELTEQSSPVEVEIDDFDVTAVQVYSWRVEELERAGYSPGFARCIAGDNGIDLHDACDLLKQGCSEHTAYEILS
jgi:hypothetical protein